jgi:hypothetical protein
MSSYISGFFPEARDETQLLMKEGFIKLETGDRITTGG